MMGGFGFLVGLSEFLSFGGTTERVPSDLRSTLDFLLCQISWFERMLPRRSVGVELVTLGDSTMPLRPRRCLLAVIVLLLRINKLGPIPSVEVSNSSSDLSWEKNYIRLMCGDAKNLNHRIRDH